MKVNPKIDSHINTKSSEPIRVIIELKQQPTTIIEYQQKLEEMPTQGMDPLEIVQESHRQFEIEIEELKRELSPEELERFNSLKLDRYFSTVYNGVAATIRGDAVELLLRVPSVNRVLKDQIVYF